VRAREPSLPIAPHHAQAAVADRLEHRRSLVRRAVVDDHELEVRDRLAQDAVERRAEVWSPVVDRDQHRDSGVARHDVP